VDKEGYRVDNYGKRLAGQNKPFVAAKDNPFALKTTPPPAAPPPPPTPQQQVEQGLPSLVAEGINDARDFDPNVDIPAYEPAFEQMRQREFERIYGGFERKNQERFARENEQLQQSLVERGLDPNSPAYQALTRQLSEQQAAARQEAMDAATTASYGAQNQVFGQSTTSAMLPTQMMQPYLGLYGQQQEQQFTGSEAEKQREFARREAERQRQFQKSLPRGGGGGGGGAEAALAQYLMGQYGQQQPQQSTGNAAVGGFAGGVGSGLTAGLMGRS
jgi:hypothetical protein